MKFLLALRLAKLLVSICAMLAVSCNTGSAELPALEAVITAGPLNATVDQVRSLVRELDALPHPKTFRDSTSGTDVEFEEREGDAWKNSLLVHDNFEFIGGGQLRHTQWLLFRPTDREELADYSQLSADWSPWHEDRPVLEARVITPEGRVIELQPAQIFEQAADSGDGGLYSDDRRVTAILAGVTINSVVEAKITTLTRSWLTDGDEPAVADSIGFQHSPSTFIPPRVMQLTVSSDHDVSWEYRTVGPTLDFDTIPASETKGRTISTRIIDGPGLFEWFENACGPQASSFPTIQAVTPTEWEDIGRAYGQRVESVIESGNTMSSAIVSAVAEEAKSWSDARKLSWCISQIHAMVRYTGMELGENAVVPVSPDQVLMRRFGDCKDQSTLLVAMLRQLGVKADVVLLRASNSLDHMRELPCVNLCNHALVALPDPQDPSALVFVDPTYTLPLLEDYPIGFLPPTCRGRMVLVCNADRPRLEITPRTNASSNIEHQKVWMDVGHTGGGTMSIRLQALGALAVELADGYQDDARPSIIENWDDYMRIQSGTDLTSLYVKPLNVDPAGVASFGVIGTGAEDQLLSRSALSSQFACTAVDNLSSIGAVQELLPIVLNAEADTSGESLEGESGRQDVQPRRNSLYNAEGQTSIYEYIIRYPAALSAPTLPEPWSESVGFVTMSAEYGWLETSRLTTLDLSTHRPIGAEDTTVTNYVPWKDRNPQAPVVAVEPSDRVLRAEYRIVTAPGEMTASEVNAARRRFRELMEPTSPLTFSTQLIWTDGAKLLSPCTADSVRELVNSSIGSARRNFPLSLVATKIQELGDPVLAQRLIADLDPISNDQVFVAEQALRVCQIRFAPDNARQFIDADAINAISSKVETRLYGESLLISIIGSMSDSHGMLSTDRKKVAAAAVKLQSILENPNVSMMPHQLMDRCIRAYLVTQLMLRKDDAAIDVLSRQQNMVHQLIHAVLTRRALPTLDQLSPENQELACELAWEELIAAGRSDLAFAFQELVDNQSWSIVKLESATPPQLPPLDHLNAESVARHVVLADLECDHELMNSLAVSPAVTNSIMNDFAAPHSPVWQWLIHSTPFRSSHLTQMLAASVDVDLESVCPTVQLATIRRSETETAVLWMVRNALGQWRFSREPILIAEMLIEHLDGDRESLAAACEAIVAPLAKDLPWFDQFAGAYGARVWSRLPSDHPQRMDWTLRILACQASRDFTCMQSLVGDGKDVPPTIRLWVDRLEKECLHVSNQHERIVKILVNELAEKPNFGLVPQILQHVEDHRASNSKQPIDDSLWRTAVEEFISTTSDNLLRRQVVFQLASLDGNITQGLDDLQAYLLAPENRSNKNPLANGLLWNSLVYEPSSKVAERLRAVEVIIDQDNFSTAHTLGCAQAITGNPLDALKVIAAATHQNRSLFDPSVELLRGLIAENLNLNQMAVDCFDRVLTAVDEGTVDTESALVARQHRESASAKVASE